MFLILLMHGANMKIIVAVLVKIQVFWNVIACLWESNYRHFEGS